ncbi:MAG TPA: hypothetical protein VGL23_14670 [Chloroflexota bacterium]|jgi:hypothetical protein
MRAFLGGAIAALLLILLVPGTALAHERRDVGKLQFVVGWINEPSLLGEPNGIDLRISDKASGQPVEGAEKTLKATVAFGGGAPREVALRARFGQKGAYTADLIPTRAGAYVFTFSGTVGDEPVTQTFESGPGRFDDVADAAKLQFPEAVPYAGDIARQVQAAETRAAQATTFGYAGIGLGLVGTVLGALALLRRPAAARA